MTQSNLEQGSVDIVLTDSEGRAEKLVLKPLPNAALTLSREYGGLTEVIGRVMRADLEVVAEVISLGLGYSNAHPSRRPPRDLVERVWATGLTDDTGGLMNKTVRYVHMLMNGGRPLPEEDDGGEGDENPQD